jgi:hypothetical protein
MSHSLAESTKILEERVASSFREVSSTWRLWLLATRLHGITFQKTVIFIVIALRASDLAGEMKFDAVPTGEF